MPRKFSLGRHRKHRFEKTSAAHVFIEHVPMMQEKILVSAEEGTSNADGLVDQVAEEVIEELGGRDEINSDCGIEHQDVGSSDQVESGELVVSISLTAINQPTLIGLRNMIKIPSVLPEGKLIVMYYVPVIFNV